jgi:esterase/lipase superfamily enzyme
LSATVFFGALAGYAALYGRLPGQAVSPEKSVAVAYGDSRGTLELGSCEVSIPKTHEVGELESPSLLRLEFSEDPAKHVVLLKVAPEPADEFYADLRAGVAKSKEKSALVFIHGYNVTFEDAARRTAQIACDLKFGGVPIFYSWPSQGKLLDYEVDETNAVWTVPHLRQFLADVARQSGAQQIHLIAHSMGNRALTGALKDLALKQPDASRPAFDQVLLTAPDIDADVFKNEIAPAMMKSAQRVTLYASSNDAALLLSKKLHGYPRAGEAGGDIVIVPGMDTVDCTAVDTSLIGHSYYGDSGSVLSDFVEVLQDAKPADQRKWLRPEFLGANKYWVFQR